MVSNTSLSVCSFPFSTWTISSRCFFIARLMKRKRCFWFMQDEAWMWVSTCSSEGMLSPETLQEVPNQAVNLPGPRTSSGPTGTLRML